MIRTCTALAALLLMALPAHAAPAGSFPNALPPLPTKQKPQEGQQSAPVQPNGHAAFTAPEVPQPGPVLAKDRPNYGSPLSEQDKQNPSSARPTIPGIPEVPESSDIAGAQNAQRNVPPWEYERRNESIERELQSATDDVYSEAMKRAFPLSPNRIRQAREYGLQVREAYKPPTPTNGANRSRPLSLQPGSAIPHVNLFPGNVTTVRFLDATGSPWPILSYVVGDGDSFLVQRAGGTTEHATNILMISPLKDAADASLSLVLAPDIPASLFLHSSARNDNPDFMLTLRIDAQGPNAAKEYIRPEKNAAVPEIMLSFLDGVAPKGAVALRAEGDARAWEYAGKCYLRTEDQLLWPSYKSVVRSSGVRDIKVYELPKVSSVVLDGGGSPKKMSITRYPGVTGGGDGR